MYPKLRREQENRKLVGWIIAVLSAMCTLWAVGVGLLARLPALWMSGIVCSSSYQLEYHKTTGGRCSFVSFRSVNGENSYSATDLVFVVQAIAVALVLVIVTAVGFVVWYGLRKRRAHG